VLKWQNVKFVVKGRVLVFKSAIHTEDPIEFGNLTLKKLKWILTELQKEGMYVQTAYVLARKPFNLLTLFPICIS
jgi:hypothetical protein